MKYGKKTETDTDADAEHCSEDDEHYKKLDNEMLPIDDGVTTTYN